MSELDDKIKKRLSLIDFSNCTKEDLIETISDIDEYTFGVEEQISQQSQLIDKLKKENEKLQYHHMINEDAFFTNKQQVDELREQSQLIDKCLEVIKFYSEEINYYNIQRYCKGAKARKLLNSDEIKAYLKQVRGE